MYFRIYPDNEYPDRELIRTPEHIDAVLKEIKANFGTYFDKFLATEAGTTPSTEDFQNAQTIMGVNVQRNIKPSHKQNSTMAFRNIVKDSINKFEKDREFYLDLLDKDFLAEVADDTYTFKNTTLRKECPYIRSILHSPAEALDKFKTCFTCANPDDLYNVFVDLSNLLINYKEEFNDSALYETVSSVSELDLITFEGIGYANVIGYGVSSFILYKNDPRLFPNRGKDAIWALWFLTQKKTFGCLEDSEFLMVKIDDCLTEHNFYFPYYLYAWYAFNIYKMLKEKAEQMDVYIDPEYRYVIVDAYMNCIANLHRDTIDQLSKPIPNNGLGWRHG
ncbi:MAG: hypothetical protein IJF84_12270 [Thermoguttaceae bacterium]|nr:hypothetical protein [Thermoguttaceae bacterium]